MICLPYAVSDKTLLNQDRIIHVILISPDVLASQARWDVVPPNAESAPPHVGLCPNLRAAAGVRYEFAESRPQRLVQVPGKVAAQ